MAKALFAILGVKEGDYRDWDAIRLWAKNLACYFIIILLLFNNCPSLVIL